MKNEVGEIAMELIANHPLYASTSGISYEEAIAVAKVIFGKDLKAVKADMDRLDGMSMKELKAEMEREAVK